MLRDTAIEERHERITINEKLRIVSG